MLVRELKEFFSVLRGDPLQHVHEVVVELREGDPGPQGDVHPVLHALEGRVLVAGVHGRVLQYPSGGHYSWRRRV